MASHTPEKGGRPRGGCTPDEKAKRKRQKQQGDRAVKSLAFGEQLESARILHVIGEAPTGQVKVDP